MGSKVNEYGVNPETAAAEYAKIGPGKRVTIMVYAGMGRGGAEWKPKAGKAVMLGPAGWVLNMGGPYGTPGIAGPDNTVKVAGGKVVA